MNEQFRSELVEADVINDNELLTPGMYADILIYSKGNSSGFSVPKYCVVTSTERKYVMVVRSGKNFENRCDYLNCIDNNIEVFGNLTKTDSLITNASDEIKAGDY